MELFFKSEEGGLGYVKEDEQWYLYRSALPKRQTQSPWSWLFPERGSREKGMERTEVALGAKIRMV